jgi:hypothetical protein
MKRTLSVLFVAAFASLVACKQAEPPKKDAANPCKGAVDLSVGSRLAAATDESEPRFALHVRGSGELGFAGFVHGHSVKVFEAATGKIVAQAKTGVCASYVTLPTEPGGFGDYCVVLDPLEPNGYSTFDLAFTAEPHKEEPPCNE